MGTFQIFSAEKLVSSGQSSGKHLAEDVVSIQNTASFQIEFVSGTLEFALQHRDVESTQIISGKIAPFKVVVEFFCNVGEGGTLRNIRIIDTMDS